MNIAIIGSRTGFDKKYVFKKLDKIHNKYRGDDFHDIDPTYYSGGALGVDSLAGEWIKTVPYGNLKVIRPLDPKKKQDYLYRNIEIITKADIIYAFWDGTSRGTKFSIDYARARNKRVYIISLEPGSKADETKKQVQKVLDYWKSPEFKEEQKKLAKITNSMRPKTRNGELIYY